MRRTLRSGTSLSTGPARYTFRAPSLFTKRSTSTDTSAPALSSPIRPARG
jgi:hypothetical protein